MKNADCLLMVFTRVPVPGRVKTRLIPVVGEEAATMLYCSLLSRTLLVARESEINNIQLCCTPDIEHPVLREKEKKHHLCLSLQNGDDLGARMASAFEEALKKFSHAVIIGCDCPELSVHDLNTAYKKLTEGDEVVLGPAQDGGYYLIGMSTFYPELFKEIVWGGADVLRRTREKIKELGLNAYELAERWDLDRPEDLKRYTILNLPDV